MDVNCWTFAPAGWVGAMSRWLFSTSKAEDATASLGSLCQSLVTLRVKGFGESPVFHLAPVACPFRRTWLTQTPMFRSFFMLCFRHSYRTNISWSFCIDKAAGTVKQVAELDHSYPEWIPALQGILRNNSLVVPLKFNLQGIKHWHIPCNKTWHSGLIDVYHG